MYVYDLYAEKYKTPIKDIKEDLNNRRDIPCCRNGRLNTVKMSVLTRLRTRFNSTPVKIPLGFLCVCVNISN